MGDEGVHYYTSPAQGGGSVPQPRHTLPPSSRIMPPLTEGGKSIIHPFKERDIVKQRQFEKEDKEHTEEEQREKKHNLDKALKSPGYKVRRKESAMYDEDIGYFVFKEAANEYLNTAYLGTHNQKTAEELYQSDRRAFGQYMEAAMYDLGEMANTEFKIQPPLPRGTRVQDVRGGDTIRTAFTILPGDIQTSVSSGHSKNWRKLGFNSFWKAYNTMLAALNTDAEEHRKRMLGIMMHNNEKNQGGGKPHKPDDFDDAKKIGFIEDLQDLEVIASEIDDDTRIKVLSFLSEDTERPHKVAQDNVTLSTMVDKMFAMADTDIKTARRLNRIIMNYLVRNQDMLRKMEVSDKKEIVQSALLGNPRLYKRLSSEFGMSDGGMQEEDPMAVPTTMSDPTVQLEAALQDGRLTVQAAMPEPKIKLKMQDAVDIIKHEDKAAEPHLLARSPHLPIKLGRTYHRGVYTYFTLTWDPDDAIKIGPQQLKQLLNSFIKGLESKRSKIDYGFPGRMNVESIDPEAGMATVYVRTIKPGDAVDTFTQADA
jgi:hypothetical protein